MLGLVQLKAPPTLHRPGPELLVISTHKVLKTEITDVLTGATDPAEHSQTWILHHELRLQSINQSNNQLC